MKLFVADAGGNYSPAPDGVILEAARSAVERKLKRGCTFNSPASARKLLPGLLGALEHEVFCVAFLDKRHRLIEFQEIFRGTIDGASVHPREIVKVALNLNAAALILCHNHPSGIATPSEADCLITKRSQEALSLIDVRIVDHCIVAGNDTYSFAERGEI